MKRRGLIIGVGREKHDKVLSSAIIYLIKHKNANPLDISLNEKIGDFWADIIWNGMVIEAKSSVRRNPRKKKMKFLRDRDKKVIFCFPFSRKYTNVKFYKSYLRWKDIIEEIWIFDLEKFELFTKFKLENAPRIKED